MEKGGLGSGLGEYVLHMKRVLLGFPGSLTDTARREGMTVTRKGLMSRFWLNQAEGEGSKHFFRYFMGRWSPLHFAGRNDD